MENTTIENTEDVIEDINEETLLSLDENLELDQEQTEIAEAKCKKEGEDMEDESDEEDDTMKESSMDSMSLTDLWNKHAEHDYNYDQGSGSSVNQSKAAKATIEKFVADKFGKDVVADMEKASSLTTYEAEYADSKESDKAKADIAKLRKKHSVKPLHEQTEIAEAEVSSDEEFMTYAKQVLQAAHGDKYDEEIAMKTAKGILDKAKGDYGVAVGMLTSGLGEESNEKEMKEETTDIAIDASDITRLVESEEGLTEEFKEKATIIFEAAVKSKIKETEETLKESYAVVLIEEVEAIKEELVDKIDNYLTYAVESWAADNAVAIEAGLRTEIAENFIQSLKTVFVENYIEVPEAKKDLVAEMESTIAKLQEEAVDTTENLSALSEQVEKLTREKIVAEASTGLADTQFEKLKSLVEDVDYTSESAYRKKVETIKEFYLNGILEETETLVEETTDESSYITTETIVENETIQEETVSPAMQKYLTALSRLSKANEATVPVQG